MMKAMEKRQEARKNQEKTLKRMMAYQKKAEQMVSRKCQRQCKGVSARVL